MKTAFPACYERITEIRGQKNRYENVKDVKESNIQSSISLLSVTRKTQNTDRE